MANALLRPVKIFVRKILPLSWTARIVGKFSGKCQRGRNTYIAPGVQLIGAKLIRVGDGAVLSEGCWLNVNARDTDAVAIDIGAYSFIGRRNFFSSGGPISIGEYCLTTIDCKFICSSHVISDPMRPYLTTGTTDQDTIRVGVNCFIGAGAVVLGNVFIGHGSVVGAGAQVMSNVPPFSVVIGNPARVVKRFSFQTNTWIDSKQVESEERLQYPDEAEYLAALKITSPELAMPLVAASSHFGNL